MDDDAPTPRLVSDLHQLLRLSRQQQERLNEALTRVFSLLDEAERT